MKQCIKCHQTKNLTEFHKNPKMRDGHISSCKSCVADYSRQHKKDTGYKYWNRHPVRAMISAAKQRSDEVTITEKDVVVPPVCPVFGTEFKSGTNTAMTLDRIDNNKGYVPGNVQVISRRANRMKSDATLEELRMFSKWVLNGLQE